MISFIKLTENDKRLIIVLLLLIILLFVIAGYVGLLIKKIMHHQGNKMEDLVHDPVVTGVINEPKKLIRFGIRKNHRQFFKESWKPFFIMLAATIVLLIFLSINNFSINIFDIERYGIGTLFFRFDWDNAPRSTFFGVTMISDWPKLISSPHFSIDAWGSYIFFLGAIVGGFWFLYNVQAYIARTYRLIMLSKKVFNKSLSNFDPSSIQRTPANPE